MSEHELSERAKGRGIRAFPSIGHTEEGRIEVVADDAETLMNLLGMKTDEAAKGVFLTAINALGNTGDIFRSLIAAMSAELEPRDAAEAMLVVQMTATHVAMTGLCQKMMDQNTTAIRESCERSVTRLSRTYLAQMEALKKYRAKAQQVVRVERVTVNEGGQAIVGDVTHGGSGDDEKRR